MRINLSGGKKPPFVRERILDIPSKIKNLCADDPNFSTLKIDIEYSINYYPNEEESFSERDSFTAKESFGKSYTEATKKIIPIVEYCNNLGKDWAGKSFWHGRYEVLTTEYRDSEAIIVKDLEKDLKKVQKNINKNKNKKEKISKILKPQNVFTRKFKGEKLKYEESMYKVTEEVYYAINSDIEFLKNNIFSSNLTKKGEKYIKKILKNNKNIDFNKFIEYFNSNKKKFIKSIRDSFSAKAFGETEMLAAEISESDEKLDRLFEDQEQVFEKLNNEMTNQTYLPKWKNFEEGELSKIHIYIDIEVWLYAK